MRKYVNAHEVDGKKIDGRGLAFYTSSITDLANPFPAKVVVILDPSKFRHTPDNSWCHDHNKDLNWVFLRGGTEAFERDFNGQYVWRSIKPVAWFEDLPAWAYTNGEVRVISEEQYKKHGIKGIEKRYKKIFLYNNMISMTQKLAKVIHNRRYR